MVLLDTLFGAAFGVTLRLISNGFQGQRLLWRPWNLVIFGSTGAFVGSKVEKWQTDLLEDLNRRNVEAGYPAIKREEINVWNSLTTNFNDTSNEVLEQGKKNRA